MREEGFLLPQKTWGRRKRNHMGRRDDHDEVTYCLYLVPPA
jgi:hypothetical protein